MNIVLFYTLSGAFIRLVITGWWSGSWWIREVCCWRVWSIFQIYETGGVGTMAEGYQCNFFLSSSIDFFRFAKRQIQLSKFVFKTVSYILVVFFRFMRPVWLMAESYQCKKFKKDHHCFQLSNCFRFNFFNFQDFF